MHIHGRQAGRKRDAIFRRHDVELLEEFAEADIGRPLIDDDAHGAFRRVRAQIDHRAGEARIAHRRHSDEELAVEIAFVLSLGAAFHKAMLHQFHHQGRGNAELRRPCHSSRKRFTQA
jgi:hypothetical protein